MEQVARIIDNRSNIDQTIRIFDSFYSTDVKVGADQFDIVYGYFTSVCSTKSIAQNFTAVLFRAATETGLNVLDLLDEIQGAGNKLQMNKIICYYLNSLKSKTSLYGVSVVPRPNQPVARNVVQ